MCKSIVVRECFVSANVWPAVIYFYFISPLRVCVLSFPNFTRSRRRITCVCWTVYYNFFWFFFAEK